MSELDDFASLMFVNEGYGTLGTDLFIGKTLEAPAEIN